MAEEDEDREQPRRRGFFRNEDPDANPLTILASYAATVIIVGFVAGTACVAVPYLFTMTGSSTVQATRDTRFVLNNDSGTFAKWRFWIGAAAGSGATAVALVAFNMRRKS
jgi:hypothetical protein